MSASEKLDKMVLLIKSLSIILISLLVFDALAQETMTGDVYTTKPRESIAEKSTDTDNTIERDKREEVKKDEIEEDEVNGNESTDTIESATMAAEHPFYNPVGKRDPFKQFIRIIEKE